MEYVEEEKSIESLEKKKSGLSVIINNYCSLLFRETYSSKAGSRVEVPVFALVLMLFPKAALACCLGGSIQDAWIFHITQCGMYFIMCGLHC